MDVYSASDGSLVQLEKQLSEYDSLAQLTLDVAFAFGLEESLVLLFFEEDGSVVTDEAIHAAYERGGQGSHSNAGGTVMYLFNRNTFFADPEVWAAQYLEEVEMPPQLNLSALSDIPQAQHPFIIAIDHLSHLQSLFQAQARAIQIAYANLTVHLSPFLHHSREIIQRAEKELQTEEDLLRGSRTDMAILPKIVIHEAFLRKRDKDSVDGDRPRTMADQIHWRRMEQAQESCATLHETHLQRYEDLVQQIEELEAHSEAERRAIEQRSAAVAQEFADGLEKIELAVHQIEAILSKAASEGAAQDLMELDKAMREDMEALIGVKNDFTLEVHLHIRQVAQFQSRITELQDPLNQFDAGFQKDSAFPHLQRLRQLPFAYAASVVEVVRRRQHTMALREWMGKLQEGLRSLADGETARRLRMEEIVDKLPWAIEALDKSVQVTVQLAIADGGDLLNKLTIGQEDVDELVKSYQRLLDDSDITSTIEDGQPNPVSSLIDSIKDLMGRYMSPQHELDKISGRMIGAATPDQSKPGQSLSTLLRKAEYDRNEATAKIDEMQAAHDARTREMADQFEHREMAMQTRQSELQEELVRLRTDLGEEMLARQALSTQLEETAREREDRQRDHEDRSELVVALQAELSQEKDRATDLGVRLQEALLDVDGLRNTEQVLLGQVQALQDERSKSMQQLSEEQSRAQDLETQLAGLRAELEASNTQLSQARIERDQAQKAQSAEAERLMRDRIAEADGDRAVLEHQNLTLNKQLDDLRIESEEKLSAARNTSIRQADGLKAELQLTRAQLRDVQRRETVLADELAMAKDATNAVNLQSTQHTDISREAVGLVVKYHETCQALINTISASTTISGSTSIHISRQPTVNAEPDQSASAAVSISSKDEMKESVLGKSLATASNFDLAAFSDAVKRTISLVKKWSKSCKSYRDLSRNRISFTSFTEGDLALFLPTRNVATKTWAAFNVSAPHNFLKLTDTIRPQLNKEWMVARIVKSEEAIASGGDSMTTNPFGLADGLRYFVHEVEEYDPTTARLPSTTRRSTSASFSAGATGGRPPTHRTPTRANSQGPSPFTPTPIKPKTETSRLSQPSPIASNLPGPEARESSASDSGASPAPQSPPPPDQSVPPTDPSAESGASAPPPSARDTRVLSPVDESRASVPVGPAPFAIASQMSHSRGPSAQLQLQRAVSRFPTASSPRDHSPAVFAPSSLGRPVSVASSSSSHLRSNSNNPNNPTNNTPNSPFSGTKGAPAAPAMAHTTSSQSHKSSSSFGRNSRGSFSKGPTSPMPVIRRASRKASNNSLSPHDDVFRPSPLGTTPPVETPVNATATATATTTGKASSPSPFQSLGSGNDQRRGSEDSEGVTRGSGDHDRSLFPQSQGQTRNRTVSSGAGMMGSRLFGLGGKGRASTGGATGETPTPTAMDMLKKFGN